ncbi:L-type lectin-domain containing receptor kinase IX.1-like [Magnolia sinica]|uniref:L-type lectin-domain containing receptor kinase IX.1-like n=1 Tax=Magnolia sinica TaxID=86752 RepID=UPI00265B2D4C|nr:L-type lectin-domain containing receptor kinase IX.1-like [Magnolia sinica]
MRVNAYSPSQSPIPYLLPFHIPAPPRLFTMFSSTFQPAKLFFHLIAFTIFSLLPPSTNSISFQIPHFDPNATNMVYEGDAVTFDGEIRLNRVDFITRVGRATYFQHVHIWDPSTQDLTDFTTRFSFIIDTRNLSTYGHGMAFFLAPIDTQIPPNSPGGFLGLFNTTTLTSPSSNQIMAVEFDSFSNPEWDPPVEHVGVIVNSLSSTAYVSWNASMHSLDVGNALISYNSTTKKLNVSLTYDQTPNKSYNLYYDIDLRKILPEWVKIGFSAATGTNTEIHRVQSWEFSSTLEGTETMKDAITRTNGTQDRTIRWLVGVIVLLGVLIIASLLLYWVVLRKKQSRTVANAREMANLTSINDEFERGALPKRFSYEELVLATNNFSEERKLGQGGFGGVYMGYLSGLDLTVAVKRISQGSKQGKREYMTEVKIISRLRHRNLVQLIGWCHDRGEFLLVYEFMPNGSLDAHLFGRKGPLTWALRFKIALGLASALLYLHEEGEQCVVHRDIKSSNVMLDSSFNVKLGDFGLARLMDHELGPRTTVLAGTLGYLAPECINTGKSSKESDVYSFGVVALEIGCGRRAVDPNMEESKVRLVDWVWAIYGRGRQLIDVADERLGLDFDQKQMECLLIVGLWCCHPDLNMRPSVRQAIQVLSFEAPLPNLPSKLPVPTYVPLLPSVNSSHPSITTSSIAEGR